MQKKAEIDDFETDDEIDEGELESKSQGGRTLNWRRIDKARERLRLSKELIDFDGYLDRADGV